MRRAEVDAYADQFKVRLWQDVWATATAVHWRRRAAEFRSVGNYGDAPEVARACENAAHLALIERWDAQRRCCEITPAEEDELARLHRAFTAIEDHLAGGEVA